MNDHHTDDIERAARRLPEHTPDDDLWPRIEQSLRDEQRQSAPAFPGGFLQLLAQSFRIPAVNLAMYAVVLLVGATMSWYLLSEYAQRKELETVSSDKDEMLQDARSDIEQAMFYYERAIGKLTVLAEQSEENLDPEFVRLQKEKIALLRSSIDECKSALKTNGAHPEVQHYLLAAYTDLQHTLEQMVSRAQ
jgi:hypothetical protein